MLIKLAIQNLREQKSKSVLSLIGIIIAVIAFFLLFSINQGIDRAATNQAVSKTSLNQITVLPAKKSKNIVSLFSSKDNRLDQSDLKKILSLDGVKEIYPESYFRNFASLEARLLGFNFITDAMVFGLDENFITDIIGENQEWENSESPYPAILPKQILEMYNNLLAIPQGLPQLSEESLKGKVINLYPGYSSLLSGGKKPKAVKIKIVAFSDKVNLIGISIPTDKVEKLNNDYPANEDANKEIYTSLFVESDSDENTPKLAEKIESLGYETRYYQKNLISYQSRLAYLSESLIFINIIIFILAIVSILSNFLATMNERSKEIALFRCLGATKNQIRKLILIEAFILGLSGSAFGIILAIPISTYINAYISAQLQAIAININDITVINPQTILTSLIFGIFLTLISAYPPTLKISKTSPISALKK